MAKISALTDGSAPTSADYFPSARSGTNRKIQATNFPIVLATWGVPCILASSGSMANNGAVSGMTALPTTYSGGAWLYLPANAIDGSSAAGFYWFVASSTTAGTVYNSTFNGASVPSAGTTTAFSTTGPGAFTGIAAGEITCITVTVPAGALGINGALFSRALAANNTAAGNKTFRARFGGGAGTAVLSTVVSTNTAQEADIHIRNLRSTGLQRAYSNLSNGSSTMSPASSYPAVDTTAATTLVFTLEKATATNHAIWDGGTVTLVYGA